MKITLFPVDTQDFDAVYGELEKIFPKCEYRPRNAAKNLINNGTYKLWHIQINDTRVGFVGIWELSDFVFIEHLATYESYRNLGFGAACLNELEKQYGKIILEAEPPESDIQKRRISFYERCGFKRNSIEYFQPSYTKNGAPVPLILLSFPEALSEPNKCVKRIYEKVYKIN